MEKKPAERMQVPFGEEPKTVASKTSGNYRAVHPLIVEEVVVSRLSELRRKHLATTAPPPAGLAMRDWTPGDEAIPTRRPHVDLRATPRLTKHPSEFHDLPLEPRVAFVLSFVDGKSTTQTIVDASGMQEVDVVEVLERLAVFGAIVVDGG